MLAMISLALLFALLALGMPIGFALALCGIAGLYYLGGYDTVFGVLQTVPLSTASGYDLVTLPMFLLMAEFIIVSRIADDLFDTATKFIGHLRGGLGIATALAGAGLAAITGSSTAGAATLSVASLPAMIKHGYDRKMAAGVVAISGTLAMLIPPSIAMVVYAIIAGIGVGPMLLAGIVPGVLVTLTIALTVIFLVIRDPRLAPTTAKAPWKERLASLRITGPMVVLILLVTGVIYAGIATPTEASALGAFGALLLSMRAKASKSQLWSAVGKAVRASCMIFTIIIGAKIFGYFFTMTQFTQDLIAWVSSMGLNRYLVILAILLLYLVLGFFLDQIAILTITVPVILPLVTSLGFDPIWFGVIVILMAEVGLVTPPLGLNAFVVARATNRPVGEIFRGVTPYVLAHLVLVGIFVAFPQLILWLPNSAN